MANPVLVDASGVRLTSPDAWFDDVGLAAMVMVHSRRFHASGLDGEATLESDSDLAERGVVVIGIVPSVHRNAQTSVLTTPGVVVARGRQRPVYLGFSLARNASTAARWSALCPVYAMSSASLASASARSAVAENATARRIDP
jgi:hypothetical protein